MVWYHGVTLQINIYDMCFVAGNWFLETNSPISNFARRTNRISAAGWLVSPAAVTDASVVTLSVEKNARTVYYYRD